LSDALYLPQELVLDVFPNPVHQMLNVRYILPVAADVEVLFYDVFGRLLHRQDHGSLEPGEHIHVLDTSRMGLPGGMVFCRVIARSGNRRFLQNTERLMLVR